MSTGGGPGQGWGEPSPHWDEPGDGDEDPGRWDRFLSVARVATAAALVMLAVGGGVVWFTGSGSDAAAPGPAVASNPSVGPSATGSAAAATTPSTAPTTTPVTGFGRLLGQFGGEG